MKQISLPNIQNQKSISDSVKNLDSRWHRLSSAIQGLQLPSSYTCETSFLYAAFKTWGRLESGTFNTNFSSPQKFLTWSITASRFTWTWLSWPRKSMEQPSRKLLGCKFMLTVVFAGWDFSKKLTNVFTSYLTLHSAFNKQVYFCEKLYGDEEVPADFKVFVLNAAKVAPSSEQNAAPAPSKSEKPWTSLLLDKY